MLKNNNPCRLMILVVIVLKAALLLAGDNNVNHQQDIEYTYLQRGEGVAPVLGNEITVLLIKADEKGDVSDDTVPMEVTYILGLEEAYDEWNELLLKLAEGDRVLAKSKVSSEDVSSYYIVELLDVAASLERKPYDIPGKSRVTTESGLEYIIISEGSGSKAAPGYTVTFHFTGFFADMTMFISSYEQETPMTVTLGIDPTLPGWFKGLCLMREGDQMRLIIPPELGYHEGNIPDNVPEESLLIFDIDLLEVK